MTSIFLGFIADICARLEKIGIHHLQIYDGHLRSWDHHRQIYIDADLALPATCDPGIFQLSIKTSSENIKLLRLVGKRGGTIQMEMLQDVYRFNDIYMFNDNYNSRLATIIIPDSTY